MTVQDFSRILERIPVAARVEVYRQMLKGKDRTPGLQEQFMEAHTQHHAQQVLVDLKRDYVATLDNDVPASIRDQAIHDLAEALHALNTVHSRLATLATELSRIQDAIEEIEKAGTKS